jgi:hypothetical protein
MGQWHDLTRHSASRTSESILVLSQWNCFRCAPNMRPRLTVISYILGTEFKSGFIYRLSSESTCCREDWWFQVGVSINSSNWLGPGHGSPLLYLVHKYQNPDFCTNWLCISEDQFLFACSCQVTDRPAHHGTCEWRWRVPCSVRGTFRMLSIFCFLNMPFYLFFCVCVSEILSLETSCKLLQVPAGLLICCFKKLFCSSFQSYCLSFDHDRVSAVIARMGPVSLAWGSKRTKINRLTMHAQDGHHETLSAWGSKYKSSSMDNAINDTFKLQGALHRILPPAFL